MLLPDRLAKSNKKATFQGVTDRTVLTGTNKRTIELHVLEGIPQDEVGKLLGRPRSTVSRLRYAEVA